MSLQTTNLVIVLLYFGAAAAGFWDKTLISVVCLGAAGLLSLLGWNAMGHAAVEASEKITLSHLTELINKLRVVKRGVPVDGDTEAEVTKH